MKTLIKFLASLIGLIILLFITAIILFVTFVNPNNFKSQISQQVYSHTGRVLTLQGDLHWSFFPWLGLKMNDAILNNAPGFGSQPFAKIAQANVEVKLMPLFQRKIEIGKLDLNGLELHLMKNAKGVNNWQDLSNHVKTNEDDPIDPPNNETTSSNDTSHDSQKFNFSVATIDIRNSLISWDDLQKGQQIILKQLQLHSHDLAENKAFPLDLQFNIQSNQPALTGNVKANSQVLADLAQQKFQFKQLQFTSQLSGPNLPNNTLNLALTGNLVFDLLQKTMQGLLQSKQLQLGKINASDVVLQFNSKNDIIDFSPIQAKLYQGNYNGNIKINLQNKMPQITSNSNLTGIQAGPLFNDLANVTSVQLTGTGNIDANLTTRGDNGPALLKNLNGEGHLLLNNGALHGINIPYWVNTGRALLSRHQLPSLPTSNQTEFSTLTGTFYIVNGIVQNKDLTLRSPQLNVAGDGSADLINQQLDYQLNAKFSDPNDPQVSETVIPVKISGSFSRPSIRPSLDGIFKTQVKEQFEKHKEAIGSQLNKFLGKNVGEKVKNQLENLFK